jgi:hypothetical protein
LTPRPCALNGGTDRLKAECAKRGEHLPSEDDGSGWEQYVKPSQAAVAKLMADTHPDRRRK